ncbi:MAG: hypothetical protein OXG83_10040 [Acidobacteria bacterium]|nr:hypothetical protein [Acidobacteriota bacterium]
MITTRPTSSTMLGRISWASSRLVAGPTATTAISPGWAAIVRARYSGAESDASVTVGAIASSTSPRPSAPWTKAGGWGAG